MTVRRPRGGRILVRGRAPRGAMVRLIVVRGKRIVGRATTTAPKGTYRVRVKLRRGTRTTGLRVRASARGTAGMLRASTRVRR